MAEEGGISSVKISKNAKGQKSYEIKCYDPDPTKASQLAQAEAAKLDSSGQFTQTTVSG